jgi:hypothetical protein
MGHEDKWFRQSPREMMNIASPSLYMDAVATRDIVSGEELFIYYGEAWEAAWEQHMADWEKIQYSEDYQSARDWSDANPDAMLLTEQEQEDNPYPSNFELRCLHEINKKPQLSHQEALARWGIQNYPGNPCRIITRAKSEEREEFFYKVLYKELDRIDVSWQTVDSLDEQEWIESPWIIRGALRFVDRPYSTDMWLSNAFRQPIGFPDDIFPDAWRGEFLSFQDLLKDS